LPTAQLPLLDCISCFRLLAQVGVVLLKLERAGAEVVFFALEVVEDVEGRVAAFATLICVHHISADTGNGFSFILSGFRHKGHQSCWVLQRGTPILQPTMTSKEGCKYFCLTSCLGLNRSMGRGWLGVGKWTVDVGGERGKLAVCREWDGTTSRPGENKGAAWPQKEERAGYAQSCIRRGWRGKRSGGMGQGN
jgi:hypothetical protein